MVIYRCFFKGIPIISINSVVYEYNIKKQK